MKSLRRYARKVVVGVVGMFILIVGLILTPTPLPMGVVFVPLGVVILSTQFRFAQRWLDQLERKTGPFGRGVNKAKIRVNRWMEAALGPTEEPPAQ